MATETVTDAYSTSNNDTSIAVVNSTGNFTLTACDNANQGEIIAIQSAYNGTDAVNVANFTIFTDSCVVHIVDGIQNTSYFDSGGWVNYSYNYAGQSWDVMNDTVAGIGSTTDWYDIFIVIGAMVVLILLTVIIIVAIRGSGLMSGQAMTSGNGSRNVGSA